MSPNRAAKKASALLNDDISARELPGGIVQLGWAWKTTEQLRNRDGWPQGFRWVVQFDVMGQGQSPEAALADLEANMVMEETIFPEPDPAWDEGWGRCVHRSFLCPIRFLSNSKESLG